MDPQAFGRACVTLTILLLFAGPTSAPANGSQDSTASNDGDSTSSPSRRIHLEDRVAKGHFLFLMNRSPTMREMLAALDLTPGISVRLRSQPGLQGRSRAHGVLQVDGASIGASLEFDRLAMPTQQFEMVAHEIGHVVEVACLGPIAVELGRVLLGRGYGIREKRTIAIETRFAIDVGREVVNEAMAHRKGPGKLQALAHQYGLGRPCADRLVIDAAASPTRDR
jgi:hypothetical protein